MSERKLTKADFPDHEFGDFRPAITRLRCPRCRSRHLSLVETTDALLEFNVRDGRVNRGAGWPDVGGVTGISASCRNCGHHWKPRKALQIDDVVSEDAGRSALEASQWVNR